jgi:hypothetical protein
MKYYANKFHQFFLMTTTVIGVTLVISSLFIANFATVELSNDSIYYIIIIIWGVSLLAIIIKSVIALGHCLTGLKTFDYKITDPLKFNREQSPRNLRLNINKTIKKDYTDITKIRLKLKEEYDSIVKGLIVVLALFSFFVIVSLMLIYYIIVGVF